MILRMILLFILFIYLIRWLRLLEMVLFLWILWRNVRRVDGICERICLRVLMCRVIGWVLFNNRLIRLLGIIVTRLLFVCYMIANRLCGCLISPISRRSFSWFKVRIAIGWNWTIRCLYRLTL